MMQHEKKSVPLAVLVLACLAMVPAMGQEGPYYDAITAWNDDNDPDIDAGGDDIDAGGDDIEAAVNDALLKIARHRRDVWIRPTPDDLTANPTGATEVTWKVSDTLEVPKKAGGRLYASGHGNPFGDTASGQQALGNFGATTVLARANDADLTWPVIRYIGHPDLEANRAFLAPWVQRVAAWIKDGIQPYVFMHMPDNGHAVALASLWTELLREKLPELEPLPVHVATPQIGLF